MRRPQQKLLFKATKKYADNKFVFVFCFLFFFFLDHFYPFLNQFLFPKHTKPSRDTSTPHGKQTENRHTTTHQGPSILGMLCQYKKQQTELGSQRFPNYFTSTDHPKTPATDTIYTRIDRTELNSCSSILIKQQKF